MVIHFPAIGGLRIRAGLATIVVEALFIYAMLIVLAGHAAPKLDNALKVFNVVAVPTHPPVIEAPIRHWARVTAKQRPSSPAARKELPSDIVAPHPAIPVDPSPLTVAAATPGIGTDASAGASTGGTGTGDGGNGLGAAAAKRPSLARWRSGSLKDSDYPRNAWEAGIGGTVSVRYTVATSGHAVDCVVVKSSGSTELDTTTCRLIERRFRFKPSIDAAGRPVPSLVTEEHSWSVA